MFPKFKYDLTKYPFYDIVRGIYGVEELEALHIERKDLVPDYELRFELESRTAAHDQFYKNLNLIDSVFNKFVKDEISQHMEGNFICQKSPSFRIQWPGDKAVHYWHYDSDGDHGHPPWEINFQIAMTDMVDTAATWVESVPGLKDFHPMNLKHGEYGIFNGNKCTHGNRINETGKTRVSFDFRAMPLSKYSKEAGEKMISATKKSRFIVGEYYALFER